MYTIRRLRGDGQEAGAWNFKRRDDALRWFRSECLAMAYGGGGAVELVVGGRLCDRLESRSLLCDVGIGVLPLGGDEEEIN